MTHPLKNSALIVVDIQPDFLPGGALACYQADRIMPGVNALVQQGGFACMVATQDWHPAGHISFASSHPGSQAFNTISLYDQPQTLWPDHCVQGTPGASLATGIHWDAMNLIIRKGSDPQVDSYSAFQENFGPNGQRPSTGLAGYLRERQVEQVYLVGLARDVCVLWSAQDAQTLGFNAHIIWDLCAPVTPESDANTRQRCEELGINIIQSAELLAANA